MGDEQPDRLGGVDRAASSQADQPVALRVRDSGRGRPGRPPRSGSPGHPGTGPPPAIGAITSATRPDATRPGSVTTSGRVIPSRPSSAARIVAVPGPKTTRFGKVKSSEADPRARPRCVVGCRSPQCIQQLLHLRGRMPVVSRTGLGDAFLERRDRRLGLPRSPRTTGRVAGRRRSDPPGGPRSATSIAHGPPPGRPRADIARPGRSARRCPSDPPPGSAPASAAAVISRSSTVVPPSSELEESGPDGDPQRA